MASLNVLFAVISARFVLLLAVIGAFVLAKAALDVPAPIQIPALILVGGYCVAVVVPLVWLASR